MLPAGFGMVGAVGCRLLVSADLAAAGIHLPLYIVVYSEHRTPLLWELSCRQAGWWKGGR
jgi:hypothetical protein